MLFSILKPSRGQLGHGTVDSNREPKLVEYLAGLKMLEVAAGGWHSMCWNATHMGKLVV
jgi:hypothetical protein